MSRQLDISKFKDVFLNSFQVGEMWLQGVLLYVKKRPPKVTIKLEALDKISTYGNIKMTAQFVDFGHRYRYADERDFSSSIQYTHGIVFSTNRSTSLLSPTSSGITKVKATTYREDGTFSYTKEKYPMTQHIRVRAWIAYIDPDTGKNSVAYSAQIRTTYQDLQTYGPATG